MVLKAYLAAGNGSTADGCVGLQSVCMTIPCPGATTDPGPPLLAGSKGEGEKRTRLGPPDTKPESDR